MALLVLLSPKKILILDEPTLGMDSDVKQAFMLALLKTSKILLISSHESEFFTLFDSRYECNSQNIVEVG